MITLLTSWSRAGYLPRTTPINDDPPPPPPQPDPTPMPQQPWLVHPAVNSSDVINSLAGFGDTLYLSHEGDWTGGERYIATVDLSTGTPITGPLVPTEGFSPVRVFNSTVYLPWADPTGAWNAPQGYSFTDGVTWDERRVGPAYHVLDMIEHDGALFVAGSGPAADGSQRGMVWRSTDNGDTWAESLSLPGSSTPRIYALLIADGAVWAFPTGIPGSPGYRFDGVTWNAEPGVPDLQWRWPESIVCKDGVAYVGDLGAFDGTRLVPPTESTDFIHPKWADATHVYAVNASQGRIDRAPLLTPTDTEIVWTPWLDLGEGMAGNVSGAVLYNGWIYIGGAQGRIWRYLPPA